MLKQCFKFIFGVAATITTLCVITLSVVAGPAMILTLFGQLSPWLGLRTWFVWNLTCAAWLGITYFGSRSGITRPDDRQAIRLADHFQAAGESAG